MSSKSGIGMGLLAGLVIGAAIGILMAPDKGTKTRGKIKDGYGDAKKKIKDKISAAKDKFADMDLEGTYNEVFSDMKDKRDEVITFLESKLASLKSEANKMK